MSIRLQCSEGKICLLLMKELEKQCITKSVKVAMLWKTTIFLFTLNKGLRLTTGSSSSCYKLCVYLTKYC